MILMNISAGKTRDADIENGLVDIVTLVLRKIEGRRRRGLQRIR